MPYRRRRAAASVEKDGLLVLRQWKHEAKALSEPTKPVERHEAKAVSYLRWARLRPLGPPDPAASFARPAAATRPKR